MKLYKPRVYFGTNQQLWPVDEKVHYLPGTIRFRGMSLETAEDTQSLHSHTNRQDLFLEI